MWKSDSGNDFIVNRSNEERRSAIRRMPPYLTAEGLVLIDRRETNDRRATVANAPANIHSTLRSRQETEPPAIEVIELVAA